MKKLTSFALALTLAASLGLSAQAVTATPDSPAQAEVKASYTPAQTAASVYKVDIAWEGLSFTYHGEQQGTWNTDTHKYDGYQAAGWDEGKGTITVTNHSNANITVTPSYIATEGYSGVTMEFSKGTLTVGSAAKGFTEPGEAQTGTITVTPAGTLPENTAKETTIGTITLTIK